MQMITFRDSTRGRRIAAGLLLVAVALAAVFLLTRSSPATVGASTSSVLPTASRSVLTRMASQYDAKDSTFKVTVLSGTPSEVSDAANLSAPAPGVATDIGQVAVVEGSFVYTGAHVPPAAAAPTGRYLTVVFSRTDPGKVLGVSVGDVGPRPGMAGVTEIREANLTASR